MKLQMEVARKPLKPDVVSDLSAQEIDLLKKYTRIYKITQGVSRRSEWEARFEVNNQSFYIINTPVDEKDEASWLCCMFAKALSNLLSQEQAGDRNE